MSDFPSYTSAAKKGEKGIGLVSKIVNDDFQWLFKRNHQEHDFGIDAQIEVVTPSGHVTGQILSVQIKFGESFFREKNRWGWVFRGEKKHFNYLANYPIPVLIVICDPSTNKCYWVQFSPEQTEEGGANWKITVPFDNILEQDQSKILALLPPVKDARSELQTYWATNKFIMESDFFLCVLSRDEVRSKDISNARGFLDRLLSTKELTYHCMGKVEFSIHGYDNDLRELWEIPEFLDYAPVLDRALHEVFFFVRTKPPAYFLRLLMFSQAKTKWVGGRPRLGKKGSVTFDPNSRADFIARHFLGLNDVTEWLGMTEEENAVISFEVIKHLGVNIPKGYKI